MILALLFFVSPTAQALQFHPHYTVEVTCVGEGHAIKMHGDFSRSAFIESAIVDGVEEGPDIARIVDDSTKVMTYYKYDVFSVSIPAKDQNIRRFLTQANIRGVTLSMACDIELDWHLLK